MLICMRYSFCLAFGNFLTVACNIRVAGGTLRRAALFGASIQE